MAAYGHAPLAQNARWSQILLIGADNFAFPIPLKKNDAGQWFFDTAAGKEEILSRRIGRNELAVIDVCGALADAQAEYFSQLHDDGNTKQYALKFISDPGKQNGLYWESPKVSPKSARTLGGICNVRRIQRKAGRARAFPRLLFPYADPTRQRAPGGAKEYVIGGKLVGDSPSSPILRNTAIPG